MNEIDFKEATNAQNAGLEIFQAIRDNLNFIVDLEWIYINPAAEKIHGITIDNLGGTTFLQRIPDAETGFKKIKDLIENGGTLNEEVFSPALNKWLLISMQKFKDGCIANIEDITEKKLIEEQHKTNEKLFATLFENSGVGIGLIDKNGRVVRANSKVCEMFGYENQEAIGVQLQQIYPPDHHEGGYQLFVDLINGKIKFYEIENQYIRKDGSIFWAYVTVSLFEENNEYPLAIAVIQDIEARKKAENAINVLIRELTELNEYKAKVLTIIAHDLKSPVSSSVDFFAYLFDNFDTLPKEELKELLKKFQKNMLNISDLLNGLLVWVQNQLNKVVINKTPIQIEKELESVIAACLLQAQEKHIEIKTKFDSTATVMADANMVSAINRNLLTNAIKFSKENSDIIIQTERKENNILISFIDHGLGMADETVKNIREGNFLTSSFVC
ncbi:MAG: senX3 1 [Segetibacter sp.]|nr:senX3 1 [Segetibacter sp.]